MRRCGLLEFSRGLFLVLLENHAAAPRPATSRRWPAGSRTKSLRMTAPTEKGCASRRRGREYSREPDSVSCRDARAGRSARTYDSVLAAQLDGVDALARLGRNAAICCRDPLTRQRRSTSTGDASLMPRMRNDVGLALGRDQEGTATRFLRQLLAERPPGGWTRSCALVFVSLPAAPALAETSSRARLTLIRSFDQPAIAARLQLSRRLQGAERLLVLRG